jgi:hypothetical protein
MRRSVLVRARERLDSKLGRCPYCLRTALGGALVALLAAAVAARLGAGDTAVAGALAVAATFTLVAASHLIAYEVRLFRAMRAARREREEAVAAPLERREFLLTLARAGAAFATVAVLGRLPSPRAAAQGTACADTSLANEVCADGADEAAAFAAALQAADAACDTLCESFACASAKCLRSAGALPATPPTFQPNGRGGVTCCLRVTCPCACFKCGDVVPAASTAIGTGANKGDAWSAMLADAKAKCEAFCKKVDSCPTEKPNCKLNGTARVEAKQKTDCHQDATTKQWTCRGKITNCPCKCRK